MLGTSPFAEILTFRGTPVLQSLNFCHPVDGKAQITIMILSGWDIEPTPKAPCPVCEEKESKKEDAVCGSDGITYKDSCSLATVSISI